MACFVLKRQIEPAYVAEKAKLAQLSAEIESKETRQTSLYEKKVTHSLQLSRLVFSCMCASIRLPVSLLSISLSFDMHLNIC